MSNRIPLLLTLLAGLASANTACTINLDGSEGDDGESLDEASDDATDDDGSQDAGDDDGYSVPADPATATLVIGTAPSIVPTNGGIGWSTISLNYPAYDCTGVSLYGSSEPVRVDSMFEQFQAALAEQIDFSFWVQLERETPDMLWRVTAFDVDAPADESTLPACYFW